jgi:L-histidine N-alpha-methyltransferase
MARSSAGDVSIVQLARPGEDRARLVHDVRAGFASTPKRLPSCYFYDGRGSELFERITELPEYDLTRNETAILEQHADDVTARVRPEELVELGSGASRRVRLLLTGMRAQGGVRYRPLDVSVDALRVAGERLAEVCPWVDFRGFHGDFDHHLGEIPHEGRRLVAFLGSTFGNLAADERVPFLLRVRRILVPEDGFLLGVDLVGDPAQHEAAYDDAAGVTAEFNRNVLHVLNRELAGDLPVEAFRHVAVWDAEAECIASSLRAERDVTARLAALDLEVRFAAGEELHTEISCKFRPERVDRDLRLAGLEPEQWYHDPARRFGLVLARPRVAPLVTGG